MNDLKQLIIDKINEVAEQTDSELVDNLNDETVLLESGLSSLGFAILVATLEEELDFDPFSEMDDAVYPRTLAEFVKIYERN
ncbi:hypothetical protein [Psychrobacter sp. P2G3]|uniref:hypothetical protein n=1 Tax=Psychrobacter sp. P2G3 TaxID=1699622 RepID=UPI00078C9951|nr:hypothetical protein [Psychrobacter sp. P2G3]AMN48594.1 hypothetical protein AK823_00665 [Psychrobacter sp. P2G3]